MNCILCVCVCRGDSNSSASKLLALSNQHLGRNSRAYRIHLVIPESRYSRKLNVKSRWKRLDTLAREVSRRKLPSAISWLLVAKIVVVCIARYILLCVPGSFVLTLYHGAIIIGNYVQARHCPLVCLQITNRDQLAFNLLNIS